MSTFKLNGRDVDLNQPSISYEEVMDLVSRDPKSIATITFLHPDGSGGSLIAGQSTSIVDGVIINATITNRA